MWIFDAITTRLDRQHNTLNELLACNKRIEALLRQFVMLPRPGSVSFNLIREESDMLVYQANLPALPDPIGDITKQKLVVTVAEAVVLDVELDLTATASPEFSAADNAAVKVSLTYVDDAGNVSPESVLEFVATDTIAPAAPGEMGVSLLREE